MLRTVPEGCVLSNCYQEKYFLVIWSPTIAKAGYSMSVIFLGLSFKFIALILSVQYREVQNIYFRSFIRKNYLNAPLYAEFGAYG